MIALPDESRSGRPVFSAYNQFMAAPSRDVRNRKQRSNTRSAASHVMRTFPITVLLSASILSAPLMSCAQGIVSFGHSTIGHVRERDWTVGTRATRFGFEEYHDFCRNNFTGEMYRESRFTVIRCGSRNFIVRTRAWVPMIVAGIGVASLLMMPFVAVSRISKRQSHDNAT